MKIPEIATEPLNWIKVPLMAALGLMGVKILLDRLNLNVNVPE